MQGPPVVAPWPPDGPAKTNGSAVFAFVASLSSFVCLVGIGGALGIVLGLIARSEIARSEGREVGRGLASAAIIVGVLNLTLTAIGVAAGITYLARPRPVAAARSAPAATAPARHPPTNPHAPQAAPNPKAPRARASRERSTQVTRLGTLTLADIAGDFEAEVAKQRALAQVGSETLVLWLVVPNCKPCDGVAASLTSPAVQKAIANVRLVRTDRDEFQIELERLGIPTEKIPGFVLLDSRNHARDFIHGGEWDADIATNIAPVLGKFAQGRYAPRRHPWRGAARDDETSL